TRPVVPYQFQTSVCQKRFRSRHRLHVGRIGPPSIEREGNLHMVTFWIYPFDRTNLISHLRYRITGIQPDRIWHLRTISRSWPVLGWRQITHGITRTAGHNRDHADQGTDNYLAILHHL